METVKLKCHDCGGTGLYEGFMEGKGEAVVCISCGGRGGYNEPSYTQESLYTGRKPYKNKKIKIRYFGKRSEVAMSYNDFCKKIKPL